jgi:predicted nicotinamide N-methyase
MSERHARFVTDNTAPSSPPLVPELRLHLAGEVTPLWQATEASMEREGLPPPYWAFAWPGGQAVARWVLDHPEEVRGRSVLDFASGSGLVAVACAFAGARRVLANEIDPFAVEAIRLNAALNGVAGVGGAGGAGGVEIAAEDLIGRPLPDVDVILAGDVCYERPMAERATAWFRELAHRGCTVVLGDPGRAYLPKDGLEPLARYPVPTTLDLEDRELRETTVWRMLP